MADASRPKSSFTSADKESKPLYLGIDNAGQIEVRRGKAVDRYLGTLFELYFRGKSCRRKRLHASAVEPDMPEHNFVAFSTDGKVRYRIVGTLVRPKSGHPLPNSETALSKEVPDRPASKNTIMSFESALDTISKLKAKGLDPDVRMPFIVKYLGESRATLYRKIGHGFPKPVKRGRGSFWSLSAIEAYKNGQRSALESLEP